MRRSASSCDPTRRVMGPTFPSLFSLRFRLNSSLQQPRSRMRRQSAHFRSRSGTATRSEKNDVFPVWKRTKQVFDPTRVTTFAVCFDLLPTGSDREMILTFIVGLWTLPARKKLAKATSDGQSRLTGVQDFFVLGSRTRPFVAPEKIKTWWLARFALVDHLRSDEVWKKNQKSETFRERPFLHGFIHSDRTGQTPTARWFTRRETTATTWRLLLRSN